ncbi:hypothetical protein DID76_00060 [Candidatus Marinamargulisbacteria bacterium SCGC AG-414-C22]|nr:hypothetical protein DID76_00060 [Candidatus Marinamargulisbacteria bacterium SCGC AG-414-C22]
MLNRRISILQEYKENYLYKLILVFIGLAAPYFFIFRLVGAIQASNVVIIVLCFHLCCLYFKRYYYIAGLVLTSHTSLCLLYYGSIFGKEVGAHTICFALVAISFSIHTTRRPILLSISIVVPIIVLFILEFSNYGLFPRFELTASEIHIIGLSAVVTTLLLTIFALAFYFKYQNKLQSVIKNSNSTNLSENNITEREKEIVNCIIDGLSNKEISKTLFIEETTVKAHVSKIYRKFDVKSRAQLMSSLTQHIDI